MKAPFSRRVPGENFDIRADEFNAMLEAGLAFKRGQIRGNQNHDVPGGGNKITVLAENVGSSDIERGHAVYITDVVFSYSDNPHLFEYFPAFKINLEKTSDNNSPALALEPIPVGEIGALMLVGYLSVQISITSEAHCYATFSGDDDGSLISADTGEFRILWKEYGTGVKWSIIFLGAGGASAENEELFKVVKKDDNTVTIQGYNADAGRYFRNYIDIARATPLEVDEQDLDSISSSGWVYMDITYSEESGYLATLLYGEFPSQTKEHFYVRVAYVYCSDGKISQITQYLKSAPAYPGRFF